MTASCEYRIDIDALLIEDGLQDRDTAVLNGTLNVVTMVTMILILVG